MQFSDVNTCAKTLKYNYKVEPFTIIKQSTKSDQICYLRYYYAPVGNGAISVAFVRPSVRLSVLPLRT